MKRISVIGGGSWATAIVKIFVENKPHVSWYLRKKENVVIAIYELDTFLKVVRKSAYQLTSSAYLGHLLVTAYSNFGRNRAFGEMIGRGYSVLMAKEQMTMVAEGYYASKGFFAITAKQAIKAPIVSAVYRILHNHLSPYNAFKLLENQLQKLSQITLHTTKKYDVISY